MVILCENCELAPAVYVVRLHGLNSDTLLDQEKLCAHCCVEEHESLAFGFAERLDERAGVPDGSRS